MGSNTDYAIMKEAEKILKTLNINFDTSYDLFSKIPDYEMSLKISSKF